MSTSFLPITTHEDIMQLNLWWMNNYHGLEFGINVHKAFVLFEKGLGQFKDIWDKTRKDFLYWEEARSKFSLI